MMKYISSILLVLLALVSVHGAFVHNANRSAQYSTTEKTKLYGFFDFKPVHGGGSHKNSLDEDWEAQQELLRQRRAHHSKEHMKQKYAPGNEQRAHAENLKHFAGKAHDELDNRAPQIRIVEDQPASTKGKKMKFFWEK